MVQCFHIIEEGKEKITMGINSVNAIGLSRFIRTTPSVVDLNLNDTSMYISKGERLQEYRLRKYDRGSYAFYFVYIYIRPWIYI